MNVNENGRDIYFNPNLSNNYCVLDNKLKGNTSSETTQKYFFDFLAKGISAY